jgi:predicted AlkP superfamily phosphohydrolase/phosphomutase
VPHARLSPGLNGVQTVEWGSHDAAYGFHASTPELEAEILATHGRHPVSGHSDAYRDADALAAFRDDLVRGAAMKGALTRDFLTRERWDFFAQVFTEAHCGGHLLWHWHDRDHRLAHDAAPAAGDGLRDVYRAIDRAIGEVLAALDDDTTVILLANHGMTRKAHAHHLLDRILIELGWSAPALAGALPPSPRQGLRPMATWAWRKLPQEVRDRARPWRERLWRARGTLAPPSPRIDRAASLCFPVENNTAHAGIRVNLKGREPAGTVEPGADYEALLDRLSQDLAGLTNLETGGRLVARILRADDLYPGPERDRLPDLFVEWTNDAPVRVAGSNRLAPVRGAFRGVRSGEHTAEGLAAFSGPGRTPGTVDRPLSCVDFAPTIANMLDVPLGAAVDGRALAPH